MIPVFLDNTGWYHGNKKVRLSYVVALLYKAVLYKKGVKFCTFGSTCVTFEAQQRRDFCSWFNSKDGMCKYNLIVEFND